MEDEHLKFILWLLKNIQRYDLVMADRGLKIREDLLAIISNLAIPPASMQIHSKGVKETFQREQ